jgi:8-amino-7-oxononanoate synthase
MKQIIITPIEHEALKDWLIKYISKRCDIPASELHTHIPFDEFGIDSVQAVQITAELEQQFDIPVEPTALFEFNTIDHLVAHLASCGNPAVAQ